jgi:AraC-like DNA-binding protein
MFDPDAASLTVDGTPTIARLLVQRFVAALPALGVDPAPVLERVGLHRTGLEDLPDRVPYALICRLYAAAHDVTGERGLGLRCAELALPETWEMLGYVIKTSATLGDALLRAARYLRLVSDATELGLHVEGERAIVFYRNPYPGLALPEITEFVLAVIATIGRHVSGRDMAALEVRFTHAAPPDTSQHARIFGAPVRFGCPHDALVFEAAILHLPIGSRDPRLCTLLEQQADRVIATLPEPRRLSRAVRDLLAHELPDGNPAAQHIAARLRMHPKTLSRRLRSEGTSHRRLLDAVRRDIAERQLTVSGKTVSEVAFLLGYADPSAFSKAFRRWTGTAPDSYRRRARLVPTG